ncbi:MAG: hypothetical protein NTV22_11830 [bacterium]|nr:hypothetical protein [bacterium]
MKTFSISIILALLVGLTASVASAARFVEENFNYADATQLNGQMATATGLVATNWTGWRSPSQIITYIDSLSYGSLLALYGQLSFDYPGYGNGDNARCLFTPGVATRINLSGTGAWYSVILRTPPSNQANKSYKIRFDRGAYYDMYGVCLSNGYISSYVGSTYSASSGLLPASTNLLVIFKIQRNSGTNYNVETWVYDDQVLPATPPVPGTGYAVTGGTTPSGGDVQALMFAMDTPGGSGQANAAALDEFRAGDTFADVTPVPEPAGLALLLPLLCLGLKVKGVRF